MKTFYDVIIIGGGPAGSAAAIHLKKAGLDVAVFEKEIFPRPHVGESLVPFCYNLFDELGILEELKQTAVRKPGVRFINKDGSHSTTYCFKNILDGPNQISFHVLRERFDKQLLDKAKADGAEVYENHRVIETDLSNPNEVEVVVQENDQKKSLKGRYLIDATGQDSFLGRKMKTKSKHDKLDRTAFLAHWDADTSKNGLEEGLLQLVYLSDTKKGWMGMQPVDVNRVSVGIVCDNAYIKIAKKKYQEKGISDWKKQFYLDELQAASYPSKILKNAKIINQLMVVGDYSYKVDKKYSTNYAIIGDAAGFLDPIFATGVYLALNTSKNVSKSIIELINNGSEYGLIELKKSYQQYEGALKLLEQFINNFYNPDFINLAELKSSIEIKNEDHTKHLIAFSIVHFLMGGDFYNEYDKYLEYLNFLSHPKQIARYHHLVIDQDKYKENSCSFSMNEAFPMLKL